MKDRTETVGTGQEVYSFFVSSFSGGGAERVVVLLANEYARRGLRTEVVVVSIEGPFRRELSDSVKLINLNCGHLRYSLWPLVLYLNRRKPKVLYCSMCDASIVGVIAGFFSFSATRIIGSLQNDLTGGEDCKTPNLLLRTLFKLFSHQFYSIVCVSEGVAESAESLLGRTLANSVVIYNPVLNPAIRELAKEPVDHPWFVEKKAPVILAVGRLVVYKNFELLIRAFAEVRHRYQAKLVILGVGPLKDDLQTLARTLGVQEHFVLLGFDSNPYKFMSKADLFVLSSNNEGLNNALVEAIHLGLPVVAADCRSGPREVLGRPPLGALVPVKDIGAMSAAIEEGLKGQLKYSREDADERLEKFWVEHAAEQYLALAQ